MNSFSSESSSTKQTSTSIFLLPGDERPEFFEEEEDPLSLHSNVNDENKDEGPWMTAAELNFEPKVLFLTSSLLFICSLCHRTFDSEKKLKAHGNKAHSILCSLCSVNLKDSFEYNEHLKASHYSNSPSNSPFSTPTPSSSSLSSLIDAESMCFICHKNCFSKTSLETHIFSSHGRNKSKARENCSLCSNSYSEKGSLRSHMDAVHFDITHACSICNKVFSKKKNLKAHIDAVHAKRKHRCETCEKSYSDKSSLRNHIESVHKRISHPCSLCDKKFTTRPHLKGHISAVHLNIKHECSFCSVSYANKCSLNNHIAAIHHMIRYKCYNCYKEFNRKSNLRTHSLKCKSSSN